MAFCCFSSISTVFSPCLLELTIGMSLFMVWGCFVLRGTNFWFSSKLASLKDEPILEKTVVWWSVVEPPQAPPAPPILPPPLPPKPPLGGCWEEESKPVMAICLARACPLLSLSLLCLKDSCLVRELVLVCLKGTLSGVTFYSESFCCKGFCVDWGFLASFSD